MTKQQFVAELNALQAYKKEINDKISALKDEYIKFMPFKVGDCIKINKKLYPTIEKAWISHISIYKWNPDYIELVVFLPKKDGTKSKREKNIWFSLKPEDVEILSE